MGGRPYKMTFSYRMIILLFGLLILTIVVASAQSDSSQWKHIYHPYRLQVIKHNVTVSGSVIQSDIEPDGDIHFLLFPDSSGYLYRNNINLTKCRGALVCEIICVKTPSQKDAITSCLNYYNSIPSPKIGHHYNVTGTLVRDAIHGWIELHPVTLIK
jgi:hypothetical protein